MSTDPPCDLDSVFRHHIVNAMRAAGIRPTPMETVIVTDTMMPHIRRLAASDRQDARKDTRTTRALSHNLTRMEFTALVHGSCGMTVRQSAELLGIAEETVKTHRTRMFRRLGVVRMMDAVILGLRLGIITLEDTDHGA